MHPAQPVDTLFTFPHAEIPTEDRSDSEDVFKEVRMIPTPAAVPGEKETSSKKRRREVPAKCKHCKLAGHNARTCPTKEKPAGDDHHPIKLAKLENGDV